MKPPRHIPFGYLLIIAFGAFLAVARHYELEVGQRMTAEFYTFAAKMILLIPCVFTLIGLLDAWIPHEWIRKHIGEGSGWRGAIYIVLLAVFQGGPLYAAFPTAHLLWEKGASMRNVFLYLGAFSTLKIPMMLFEMSFLGWQFTLVRAAIALPVFILIAELMAAYTRHKDLQLMPIEAHPHPKK